jgi:V8-like Glu-specific endopeptidase
MRSRRNVVLALLALSVLVAVPSAAASSQPAPLYTPTAQHFNGRSTVGAIFPLGLSGPHTCTASVLDSPKRNLIITAAHCVIGAAIGWSFAPGYVNGRTLNGVWTVTAAYLDPHWITNQDPNYDFAILRVAPRQMGKRWRNIEDVTGGNVLTEAPKPGSPITDVAYNIGDNVPITCTAHSYYTFGYPSFNCHGYVAGSSGSPWLQRHGKRVAVTGVIGGPHQGGCSESTSYTSRFGPAVQALLQRANTGGAGDVAPIPGSDGC